MYSSMHFSPVCDPHDFDYINIQFDCIDIVTHDFNVAQISCLKMCVVSKAVRSGAAGAA